MLLCTLLAVFGGWALDKYGPRNVGIFIGTFTGLSLLLTSRTHAPWQLLITYSLLLALGTGPIYGTVNTTASRWFVKKRGLVVGITSSGGGVGTIVIAPFAAFLISNFGWRAAFVVMGVISWAIIVAVSLPLRKDPQELGLFPDGRRALSPEKDIHKKGAQSQWLHKLLTTMLTIRPTFSRTSHTITYIHHHWFCIIPANASRCHFYVHITKNATWCKIYN